MEITNRLSPSKVRSIRDRCIALLTFENLSLTSLIAMSIGVLYTNYSGLIYSEIISFLVQDGWCDTKTQGIGMHCFGDFYAPITISSSNNPWSDDLNLAYSPVSFSYFNVISSDYVSSFSPKLPLLLNLIFAIFALGFPSLHMFLQKTKSCLSGKWVLPVMLTSTPSLMMIDRGSNNFLLIPLLYMYQIKIREGNLKHSVALLATMSLWKPQMLLFGLLLFTKFGLRRFLLASITSISLLFLSFSLYPKNISLSILNWIENSREYQTYSPSPSIGNFSFASFIGLLDSIRNKIHDPSRPFSLAESSLSINEVSLISLMYGFVAFGTLLLVRNQISSNYQFLAVTTFFLQLPGTTYGYYLVLLILPLLFMIRDNEFEHVTNQFQKWNYFLYGILLFVLIPAWPVSLRSIGIISDDISISLGLNWTFSHALLSVLSLLLIFDFTRKFLRFMHCTVSNVNRKMSLLRK